jgi:hypothetical protein
MGAHGQGLLLPSLWVLMMIKSASTGRFSGYGACVMVVCMRRIASCGFCWCTTDSFAV